MIYPSRLREDSSLVCAFVLLLVEQQQGRKEKIFCVLCREEFLGISVGNRESLGLSPRTSMGPLVLSSCLCHLQLLLGKSRLYLKVLLDLSLFLFILDYENVHGSYHGGQGQLGGHTGDILLKKPDSLASPGSS